MNVLVLLTRVPVPPWRGDQVRAYHLVRRLAARHRLTLAVAALGGVDPEAVAATRALGVRVHVLPVGRVGPLVSLAAALARRGIPGQVALFDRPHVRRALATLRRQERFDVVHAQLVRTGPYALDVDDAPVVVDLVDALSANFARRAGRDRGALAWLWREEARRLASYERQLVAHARVTMVVSATDRDAIGVPSVRVVPNGVDVDAFAVSTAPRVPGRIVFGGNLGYFPNVDAACWLVEEILPRIRARVAGATVRLVGARPSRRVRALESRPGVSVVADVPDMAAELARAALVVVPMRAGSGLQNKVLEALAVGTPLVATSQAARPLGTEATALLDLADDAEAIAAAAASVLAAGGPRPARAAAGAAFVRERFGWDAAAGAVEDAWADAARMRS